MSIALDMEEQRRAGTLPIQKRELLEIFTTTPRRLIEEKQLFVKFCEAFIFIAHRTGEGSEALRPIVFNNAQHCVLNAYFDRKQAGLPVRVVGLKGRQMGFSTAVEIIGFLDTICKGGQNMLVATEHKEKSGYNIYEMFYRILANFPVKLPTAHIQDGKRIQFGETLGRGMLNISGETTSTSYTYKFIHLSEAAFFQSLNTFLNMLLQTVLNIDKNTSVFLETTANRFGDEFHDRWTKAEEGKSGYTALFIPWFVHEEYEIGFKDEAELEQFKNTMNQPEMIDRYGDEVKLLSTPTYEVKYTDTHKVDIGITYEKLKWRRLTIDDNCNGSILEFNRQYPTSAEEAFINANINVIDPQSLVYYRKSILEAIERGRTAAPDEESELQERRINWTVNEFIPDERSLSKQKLIETRQGVITIYQEYHPYKEYIMGSDHAQGLDSGDFSVAYIVSRNPKEVVAKIRGYDGRRLDAEQFAYQMFGMYKRYDSWICPENNNAGVIPYLMTWGCNKFMNETDINRITSSGGKGIGSGRVGWMSNEATKKAGVTFLQETLRKREWHIPDMQLIDELRTLVYNNGKVQAARKGERRPPGSTAIGFYDDCVFAFIGCLLADRALPPARSPSMIQDDFMQQQMMVGNEQILRPGESVYSRGWA